MDEQPSAYRVTVDFTVGGDCEEDAVDHVYKLLADAQLIHITRVREVNP